MADRHAPSPDAAQDRNTAQGTPHGQRLAGWLIPGAVDRYLMRSALTPLALTLLVAALLLILEQMLRLLDFVLVENGPVDVVWKMLAFLVPHYLALALPLALFLGIVLAVRRLALSSELDAMAATGLSPWRLMRPFMILALGMMAVNLLLLAYVKPYAQYGYHQLRFELQAGMLGARVPVGRFMQVADGVTLKIGALEDGGKQMRDLFVSYEGASDLRSTFTARRGRFMVDTDRDTLLLRLEEGRQMVVTPGARLPGVLNFQQQDLTIPLPPETAFRARGGQEREATLPELARMLFLPGEAPSDDLGAFRASFHFRLIHTLTFLPLPFLAFAAGVTRPRAPGMAGPVLGLAAVILYHELLEEWAEAQVAHDGASPFLVMWPLLAAFSLLALWRFYRLAEIPGSLGPSALDRLLGRLRRRIRALARLYRRGRP
ncbi:LptF/LptG family permease [Yunchengibacter salinarum]|uniref:LptF/LptG family permease n=1 Tax=Yunchengibacter salinarum TaxID=3133399 RepID=UPI0035B5F3C7